MGQDILVNLKSFAERFDRQLHQAVESYEGVPSELYRAIEYAVLSPGKRVRPFLVKRCCQLVGGAEESAWSAAVAIECVHAFSLVHDDLPAMDNDDWRRGRPTVHKKFSEALAILAGDALVFLAFEVLARFYGDSPLGCRLICELVQAGGATGMIGGQVLDITGEGVQPDPVLVRKIHRHKTARLFRASCRMGAICSGASEGQVEMLGEYGNSLGHAFQIADDLLDVLGSENSMGKSSRKDASAGKQTLHCCVGQDEAQRRAEQDVQEAIKALVSWGHEADDLRELACFAVSRNY